MAVPSPKSEVSFHCRIAVNSWGIFNKLLVFQRGGCGENSDLTAEAAGFAMEGEAKLLRGKNRSVHVSLRKTEKVV
ncbi:hypothetical protein DOM22_04370 [Bdellovibrio sp. ZAP7]|nr:hypothetical protein DOM22_04370 [Bdellovibrio sp. ZAP7]